MSKKNRMTKKHSQDVYAKLGIHEDVFAAVEKMRVFEDFVVKMVLSGMSFEEALLLEPCGSAKEERKEENTFRPLDHMELRMRDSNSRPTN